MTLLSDDAIQPSTAVADLSESERHRLLAAERRRTAFDVLADRTAPVDVKDLAATVAAREAEEPPDRATVERVVVDLHHAHLPKMDEFGVVDYDPEATRIESCPSRSDP